MPLVVAIRYDQAAAVRFYPHAIEGKPLMERLPIRRRCQYRQNFVLVGLGIGFKRLLAGVGFLIWCWSFLRKHDEALPAPATKDPLTTFTLTPSQRSLGKYLFLVVALLLPVFQSAGALS